MIENIKCKLTQSKRFIRLLEMTPGLTSWSIIFAPIFFAIYNPMVVVYYIIIFDVYWFIRSLKITRIILIAYKKLKISEQYDWLKRLRETEDVSSSLVRAQKKLADIDKKIKDAKGKNIDTLKKEKKKLKHKIKDLEHLIPIKDQIINWKDVYHVIIFPTFKEELETLLPSASVLAKSNYPMEKVVCCFVGEERDKERFNSNAKQLKEKFKNDYFMFLTLEHPDGLPGEGKVKGAAVSWASKEVKKILNKDGIADENILVSSLDSDTQVHKEFLAALTYRFVTTPKRHKRSFQPIPLFHNNIWDTPAPNRVMAINSSFWQMVESIRLTRLRNFSGHSFSMAALEAVDYWDRYSIVEDGKQYWRSYFSFDGDYRVVPVIIPVYNDAVLSETYFKTIKSQYLQRRRWYYGASDFPYIIINSIRNAKIPLTNRLKHIWIYFDGTVSLATASLVIAFVAWLPLFLNPEFGRNNLIAHNLPIVASRILTVAAIGLLTSMWISVILLPERPKKYHKAKGLFMVLQWLFLPPIVIFLSTFPALDAQTRLIFGKYLGFYVTPKCVKK